jgi:DNA-binding transcriptional ArsR family regulator
MSKIEGDGLALSHPLPDDLVELISERFRALSEPTRIKLLDRLRVGEASVLDLSEAIATTQQNVSKHLGVLHRAGIVARRKQGNFVYYSIADAGVLGLCESVCGSLQQHVESLRQVVGAGAHTSGRRPLPASDRRRLAASLD